MARRLAERFEVVVWARRPDATAAVLTAGVRRVDRLAELGACDVVGVCVTDGEAVQAVVEGLVPGLAEGTVVCVHSTVSPDLLEPLDELVRSAGASLVDAPVSGGADAAAVGRLRVMAGGDPYALGRCRDVLDQLGTVLVVGGIGSGQRTKLLNNALYAAQLALASDILGIAESFNLDRDAVTEAIGGGSGASFALSRLQTVSAPSRAGHVARLLTKDLALFERASGDQGDVVASVARPFLDLLGRIHTQEDQHG
jgi:3-hydroxyisobutyrate dehydrogenase-like beta-hydroxyacid dehydrogenase